MIFDCRAAGASIENHQSKIENRKRFTDMRDLAMLLLAFPELKADRGVVRERLEATGASAAVLATWTELVAQEFLPGNEDDEFS